VTKKARGVKSCLCLNKCPIQAWGCWSVHCGGETNLMALPRIEPRCLGRPVRTIGTTLIELYVIISYYFHATYVKLFIIKRQVASIYNILQAMIFWVVKLCSPVGKYGCFGGIRCLHIQGRSILFPCKGPHFVTTTHCGR
jgi:hypothetical protein